MQKGRFIKNAAIMTLTALMLRTIGMFFRVWLSGQIGSQGMGLYQLIFSVYMLAATFATSGITTAVTRLIAEELELGTAASVKRILKRSITLALIIGVASAVLVYVFSDVIAAHWIKDIRAARSLRILSLSLPFMGISSCIKGYFYANRRATTPSAAQVFEQLIRIAVVFLIIDSCAQKGLEYACAAVLIADTIAEAASCLFVYAGYVRDKRKLSSKIGARAAPPYSVVRRLVAISAPIAGGRYLTTLLRTVESLLVPGCLAVSLGTRNEALSVYGAFRGMAMPVMFFLSAFLTAISTLLVPELSSALSTGNKLGISSSVKRTIHITMSVSMLVGGAFFAFGEDIGKAVYGTNEVGYFIVALAPLIPLMYMESVVTGVLNGLDQQTHIFAYNVVDSVLRIILIYVFVPRYGVSGFIGVTVFSNLLTPLLCLNRVLKVSNTKLSFVDWVLRPLLCTAAAITVAIAASRYMTGLSLIAKTVSEITICAAIYVLMLYATGGMTQTRDLVVDFRKNKLKNKFSVI